MLTFGFQALKDILVPDMLSKDGVFLIMKIIIIFNQNVVELS